MCLTNKKSFVTLLSWYLPWPKSIRFPSVLLRKYFAVRFAQSCTHSRFTALVYHSSDCANSSEPLPWSLLCSPAGHPIDFGSVVRKATQFLSPTKVHFGTASCHVTVSTDQRDSTLPNAFILAYHSRRGMDWSCNSSV